MQNLSDAAARDRAEARERALLEQQARAAQQAAEPQQPEQLAGDPMATIQTRREFDDVLTRVSSDETGLVVLGIDNIDAITAAGGSAAADHVRRAVAGRISVSVRRNDVVALVGDNSFAVLLVDVDRRSAFEISKRLRSRLVRVRRARRRGDRGVDQRRALARGRTRRSGRVVRLGRVGDGRRAGRRRRPHARRLLIPTGSRVRPQAAGCRPTLRSRARVSHANTSRPAATAVGDVGEHVEAG